MNEATIEVQDPAARRERLIELTRRRKEVQENLNAITEEIDVVRDAVLADMQREGTQSWRGSDGTQIYLTRRVFASLAPGADPLAACAALRSSGLEFLVSTRPNTTLLASWVREREEEGAPEGPRPIESVLPEAVRPHIKISEVYTPTVRGA